MKTQHHLLRSVIAATCFLLTLGLYAQHKTIEEVWSDMRPMNGVSEWTMEGNGHPLPNYIAFTFDHRGEMLASYPMGGSFEPPNPTPESVTNSKEMETAYVVFSFDHKPIPSGGEKAHGSLEFPIRQNDWEGQFKGSLSEDGEMISGTITVVGKEEPVLLRRSRRK